MRLLAPLVAVALLSSTPAWADSSADTAQLLFDEAVELMANDSYEEACAKLEKSVSLDDAIGARFALAECHEALGKLASAWRGYVRVVEMAAALGQGDRQAFAQEKADAARARVATVTIEVDPAVKALDGLEVRVGDETIAPELFDTPIPIDPGAVAIRVAATGRAPWKHEHSVAEEGSSGSVRVAIDSLPALAAEEPSPANTPATAPVERDDGGGPNPLVISGFSIAGAGAVLAGIGVGLAFSAKSDYDSAVAGCTGAGCDQTAFDGVEAAREQGDLASILFGVGAGVGAAGLAVGVIGLLQGGDEEAASNRLWVAPGVAAARLGGTF